MHWSKDRLCSELRRLLNLDPGGPSKKCIPKLRTLHVLVHEEHPEDSAHSSIEGGLVFLLLSPAEGWSGLFRYPGTKLTGNQWRSWSIGVIWFWHEMLLNGQAV